jgi:hypothetical protein
MVLALIFLNLAGGDCVEDLERLESDSGFAAILRAIEPDVLSPAERRLLKKRGVGALDGPKARWPQIQAVMR